MTPFVENFENSELKILGRITAGPPVQAEGTVNGFPFYFRARWHEWSFAISENPHVDPIDIQIPETAKEFGYLAEGQVGNEWEYLASYMPFDMAKDIMFKCSRDYLKTKL